MKINIFLNIKSGPYGGGNQFLKALRDYFIKIGAYTDNIESSDVILFNSHHQIEDLLKIKYKFPKKIFIHRIDGPVFLIRKDNKLLDKLIYKFNNKIADATVFQSNWSKERNLELGLKPNKFETIIYNAPNSEIFNKYDKIAFDNNRKTKIIATSWASNMSKGFKSYKYLDEKLSFLKYEMTFCGNSPFEFKNIKHIKALPSIELAKELKKHDIFITASKNDPCSNSLIEALHCSLPAIGLNDGGHPEIIDKGGLVFNEIDEIDNLLNSIEKDYSEFQKRIKLPTMEKVGQDYYNFIENVYKETKVSKETNLFKTISLYKSIYLQKIRKQF